MEEWKPDQLKQSLDNGDKVFLKLWKRGCGICKLSNSATDRMEKNNTHGLTFAKINVDDHPEMLDLAGTGSLPLFFVFADKEKKGMYTGFKGLEKLQEFVDESLS
ncbi:thioredoxin family protein [Pseudobacteriovorax antillogorgiicola]|uniref:Thioredoxin 1 n=1 Tax=Pseudobacteriovorax antillogorgiicola TaxID=1513793 RepID=A0A1Y6CRB5_9BACT|nr:thioredoxin family protein [Pseudobacteriovorax antillogorgiicola]TCS45852.1 thioredoxin 1 [Pseudobacteriovorax antillogorgiicola]SMF71417.1 thioredoxin 1 [Pseudobacteriovorax antillogorgiicola]